MKFLLALCCCLLAANAAEIAAKAFGSVFIRGESPEFESTGKLAGAACTVTDWRGREAARDVWPATGPLRLNVLPPGYYTLTVSGTAPAAFAVVADPAARKNRPDPFFALDTAQSWLVPNKPELQRGIAGLVRLAGITRVRDRLGWNNVNPAPDRYEWGAYLTNAELLAARGIEIVTFYARSPDYVRTTSPRLPDDLAATWRFARAASETFRGKIDVWEFWNEPDIHYAPEPVWEFAASLKAAALGHRAGNPGGAVLPGAVCNMVRTGYDYGLYANGIADYTEAVNFHTYAGLVRYPKIFGEMREFMSRAGLAGRALWVTENGTNLEGTVEKNSGHTPEQELIVAEFLPKSQILLMNEGVARSYFFVFPPFKEREGRKDWGLLRQDYSVKITYAALANLTAELGAAELEGELKAGEGVRAFLFRQPDGSQTLVFWSISQVDRAYNSIVYDGDLGKRPLSLAVPAGLYRLTDLTGMEEQVASLTGTLALTATRFPAYLSGLAGLKPEKPPFPAGKLISPSPSASEDPSVVLKVRLNRDDFKITNLKSLANLAGETGRLVCEAWNLSPEPKRGSIVIRGAKTAGLPEHLELPPFGRAMLELTVTPETPPEGAQQELRFGGVFNGKQISESVIPVYLHRLAFRNTREIRLDAERPERWRRNDSALTSKIAFDPVEQALRFDADWGDRYAWIYPEYILNLPEESFGKGVMLAFDIKSVQDKPENDFDYTYLMLVAGDAKEHGKAEYVEYTRPLTEWQSCYVPFHAVKMPLENVRMIRLGMNPKGSKITYWIRNLRLYIRE